MQSSALNDGGFSGADRESWLTLAANARNGAGASPAIADTYATDRWAIVQRVDDPVLERAAAQAREDVEAGATGLSIVFEGAPNAFGYGLPSNAMALAKALDGVPLARTHLRIDLHPRSRVSVDWLVHLFGVRKVDPQKVDISFGIDPAAIFAGTGRLRMSIEAMHASMPQSLAHYFALGLPGVLLEADGRVFHNAGATAAQELGAMVASAVSYLRMFQDARQPLIYAAPHIGFSVAVDQDQSVSVAKLRAIRLLWAQVLRDFHVDAVPTMVHAATSWRMLTGRAPETNIVRNTLAATAAAAGGADTICILPHTIVHGLPDAAARRIARNTQLVMAHEGGHGAALRSLVARSDSLDAQVAALCAEAWDAFRAIEAEGGILASVQAGQLQSRISETRKARARRYRSGENGLVGSTLHPVEAGPAAGTLAAERRAFPDDGVVSCEALEFFRLEEEALPD